MLTDARRATRVDAAGELVTLEHQDRSRWDHAAIAVAAEQVEQALRRGSAGTYQLQAAIAACHATARIYGDTDWSEIAALYGLLEQLDDDPVTRLNRAVALAEAYDPATGLALLDDLDGLDEHHLRGRSQRTCSAGWTDRTKPAARTTGPSPAPRTTSSGGSSSADVRSCRGSPIGSNAMSNAAQFIYTMHKVGRFHPPDREVLKDISLSFYPGAKIGVIGPNGSGKSSLLRIMAGVDDGFTGEARLSPGFTVGMLEQEPHLDESKDVKGNVMDGVAEVAGLLERYDAVLAKYADPDADYDKIGAEQAELEAKIQAAGADDLERQIEIAMDALRLPPGDADGRHPVRRREAPGRAVPPPAVPARPAAARRAHQPPRRRVGGVAGADPPRLPGHRRGHHPRPLLPRQRGPLDPRARPGQGASVRGQLLELARAEAGPPREEEKGDSSRRRTLERELEWVRMAPKARQAKGKARLAAYDKLRAEAEEAERGPDKLQIQLPAGRRLGGVVIEADDVAKGYGDRLLIEDLDFKLPPAGHRRRDRRQRRRQDDPVPHDHRPGGSPTPAPSRSATRSTSPTSTRAATASIPRPPSTRRSPATSSS